MTVSEILLQIGNNNAATNKSISDIILTFDRIIASNVERIGKNEKEIESLKNQLAEKKKLKIHK